MISLYDMIIYDHIWDIWWCMMYIYIYNLYIYIYICEVIGYDMIWLCGYIYIYTYILYMYIPVPFRYWRWVRQHRSSYAWQFALRTPHWPICRQPFCWNWKLPPALCSVPWWAGWNLVELRHGPLGDLSNSATVASVPLGTMAAVRHRWLWDVSQQHLCPAQAPEQLRQLHACYPWAECSSGHSSYWGEGIWELERQFRIQQSSRCQTVL